MSPKIKIAAVFVFANFDFLVFLYYNHSPFLQIENEIIMIFYSSIIAFCSYIIFKQGEGKQPAAPVKTPTPQAPAHPYLSEYERKLKELKMTPLYDNNTATSEDVDVQNLVPVEIYGTGDIPQGRIQNLRVTRVKMKAKDVEQVAEKEEKEVFVGSGYSSDPSA